MVQQGFHLKPPKNWMNDPNGFIFYKGKYHLFYQHFPYEPFWSTMHWGHAVSEDLVSWEHCGIALYPSQYWDQNGCYSGSALEENGTLYLYYTGVRYTAVSKENIHQRTGEMESSQLLLTSQDGIRFDNFRDKKVIIPPIEDPAIGDKEDTRDPKVWKEKDEYYMILGSTTGKKGKLLFYRSRDGKRWRYWTQHVAQSEQMGWMWECPDLFYVSDNWVLCISPMGLLEEKKLEQNHSICTVVSFQQESGALQMGTNYQFIDYGFDFYAPQSTIDKEGRRIIIGWMRMPQPVGTENPWNGMMCTPRVVEVKNGHIYFRMHPNIEAAFRKKLQKMEQREIGKPYRLQLQLEHGEKLMIGGYQIIHEENKIKTDRQLVFPQHTKFRTQCSTPMLQGQAQLDILVDHNIIEIFINNGEYVISNIIYEDNHDLKLPQGKTYCLWQMG